MNNYGWHWSPCNRRGVSAGGVIALIAFAVIVANLRTVAEIGDAIIIGAAVMFGLILATLVTVVVVIARRASKRQYRPVKVISVNPLGTREIETVSVSGVPHANNCLVARYPDPANWESSGFPWCTCKGIAQK